ncbi:hypothetical protein niasHT_001226 [Heterodera trifolii]|uniref:Vacuolar protein-sorting-associated protein 25 n=1 Tax=Heterodera trifolii TaxID=157864 RepID=A0ABD2M6H4_9BILA
MSFQWPWHFDFPPFFTIQPNLSTRDKQLKAWGRLVLDYCQANRIYTTDLDEISKSDLFNNRRLNRHLDLSGIRAVFEFLELQKHVEWKDKDKTRCNIYWRRPEEWGQLLYEWANSIGLLNTVVTLYELTQGEDVVKESFFGLDKDVLLKGLQHLEDQGKAVLIDIDGEKGGVKFL